MENLLNWLDTKYVDFFIFILVIAAGFFQQRLLKPFIWFKKDLEYDQTLKTFIISTVFCAVYVWIYKYQYNGATIADQNQGFPWVKMFVSFACAESFYNVILKLFKIMFKQKTGIDIDTPTTQPKP